MLNIGQLGQIQRTKTGYEEKFKITKRDLEIIQFCIEMRFASTEQLYRKFFKNIFSGGLSVSDRWAKERIFKLKKLGYLKAQKNFTTGQNLHLTTLKGYLFAKQSLSSLDLPRPIKEIDVRQFDHDKQLTDCRLHFEQNFGVTRWISERTLQSSPEMREAFGENSLADGLGINSDGTAFFFELERTLKTKARYKKKISRYIYLLRLEKPIFPNLKSVHFVCARNSILKALEKETKIYGPLFKLQMIDEFFNTNKELQNENA